MSEPDTKKIRALNDAFRTSMVGGKVLMTAGVNALPQAVQMEVIKRVREFTNFNTGDDPYGEHDFGEFRLEINRGGAIHEEQFFWKIDYYDSKTEMGSPDASDPSQTTRVLTILLAEEY